MKKLKGRLPLTLKNLKKAQPVFNNVKKSRYYFIIIHHPSISRRFIRDAEALRAKQKVRKQKNKIKDSYFIFHLIHLLLEKGRRRCESGKFKWRQIAKGPTLNEKLNFPFSLLTVTSGVSYCHSGNFKKYRTYGRLISVRYYIIPRDSIFLAAPLSINLLFRLGVSSPFPVHPGRPQPGVAAGDRYPPK